MREECGQPCQGGHWRIVGGGMAVCSVCYPQESAAPQVSPKSHVEGTGATHPPSAVAADSLDIFYSSADAIAYLEGYVGGHGKAARAVEYLKTQYQPVATARRPARCESCGYVESHDPNCPRDRTPWREWAERHDIQGDDTELKTMFDAERAGALARSEKAKPESEEAKALIADAARYRWLKNAADVDVMDEILMQKIEEWDSLIDTQIAFDGVVPVRPERPE